MTINNDEVKQIYAIDKKNSSMSTTNIEDRTNHYQLSLACNLWLALADDLGGELCAKYLRYVLIRDGFVATVKGFEKIFYNSIVEGIPLQVAPANTDLYDCAALVYQRSGSQGASLFTRFPKRFTYDCPDDEATYEKFLTINKRCWSDAELRSTHTRGGDETYADVHGLRKAGNTLLTMIKEEIKDMVGEAPHNLYEEHSGAFSSGSTAEHCKTVADRICVITRIDRRFLQRGFYRVLKHARKKNSYTTDPGPYWISDHIVPFRPMLPWRRYVDCSYTHEVTPTMIQVPKNLTSRRLICPEPAARAYRSSKVLEALRNALEWSGAMSFINERDQAVNRFHALLGSAGLGFATMDLTSASDSIAREYMIRCFPESWRPYLIDSVSDYVMVRGERTRVRCYSTSGNKLTWLTEAIFFLAVVRVVARFFGVDADYLVYCFVYGDDIVIPEAMFEAVCDVLEILGCVVNRDKSYAVGDFRESCGGDYLGGLDITPVYWPRRVLNPNERSNTLASLCHLQHALYRYPTCRLLLNEAVRALDPKITYSYVGCDCMDLWDGSVTVEDSENSQHKAVKAKFRKKTYGRKIVRTETKYGIRKTLVFENDCPPQWYMEWQYYSFLLNGPRYLNDRDEAEGISYPYLYEPEYQESTDEWTFTRG